MNKLFATFCLLFSFSILTGCQKKEEPSKTPYTGASYFSIIEYGSDQFRTYWGQPFSLEKIRIEDGKVTDSAIVPAAKVDWAKVLKPFFESDISHPKYLDQYTFSSVDDDLTTSRTYIYEAKDKKLFTQMLQIATDPFTNKIKSVFIETRDGDKFRGQSQKLFYIPVKLIQIQQFESSLLGKDKNIRTEYRFLY
jgi:hypothetical protein